jgi:hypothetical protein
MDWQNAEVETGAMLTKFLAFIESPDPTMALAVRAVIQKTDAKQALKKIENWTNCQIEFIRSGEEDTGSKQPETFPVLGHNFPCFLWAREFRRGNRGDRTGTSRVDREATLTTCCPHRLMRWVDMKAGP